MADKPRPRQLGHLFERAFLFKKVRCVGYRLQSFFTVHLAQGLPVQIENVQIGCTNDQQGRTGEIAKRTLASKIGATAAADDGFDRAGVVLFGRRQDRGCGACTGAEVAEAQPAFARDAAYRVCGCMQTPCQKVDIEPARRMRRFFRTQQIKEQRAQAGGMELMRNVLVARTVP